MKGLMFTDELIPMVLDGTKIMTRRIMKVQPGEVWPSCDHGYQDENGKQLRPRYNPGEVVYLKEAWQDSSPLYGDPIDPIYRVGYEDPEKIEWKNKMFMPERLSRCKVEITSVKAERLQDISEEDAVKEGCKSTAVMEYDGFGPAGPVDYTGKFAVEHFEELINRINGRGTWEANPWCWCYGFRRVG